MKRRCEALKERRHTLARRDAARRREHAARGAGVGAAALQQLQTNLGSVDGQGYYLRREGAATEMYRWVERKGGERGGGEGEGAQHTHYARR